MQKKDSAYVIDFISDVPEMSQIDAQRGVVTGRVLRGDDLQPSGLTYTITVDIEGGANQASEAEDMFPPSAGRAPSRFANKFQPEIIHDVDNNGIPQLAIRLLGRTGTTDDSLEGKGLIYYRSSSTKATVTLTIGEQYHLENVHYTLTGIDSAFVDEPCGEATCFGSFIDAVNIINGDENTMYTPLDSDRVSIVNNIIKSRFIDIDKNGYPDTPANNRLTVDDTAGHVTVFHPSSIGTALQFVLSDTGEGIDGDPDGHHTFDAEQMIGLASGITFDLVERPVAPSIIEKTEYMTQIMGRVSDDTEQENGVEGLTVSLFTIDQAIETTLLMTTTTSVDGTYKFDFVPSDQPYRIEVALPMRPVLEDVPLNPVRLLRMITPTVGANNEIFLTVASDAVKEGVIETVDDNISAVERAVQLSDAGYLLPDLTPLSYYPTSDALPLYIQEEIAREYPGLEKWYIDTETQPGRVLMRFGTLALNQGDGPIHVVGGEIVEFPTGVTATTVGDGVQLVYQRVYKQDGSTAQMIVGTFIYHEGHDHVHMDNFEQYNLRDEKTDEIVRRSGKISFCLTDVLWPIRPDLTEGAKVGTVPTGWECGMAEQSINVGYSDYYGPELVDQWIDVTGLPSGRYWLEVIVNPDNQLFEQDYTNNRVRIPIQYNAPSETEGSD